jgi:hypothetical protein
MEQTVRNPPALVGQLPAIMLSQKGASVTLAIIAQEPQNATEATPFCYAFLNCQIFKGEFLLLREAACSCAVITAQKCTADCSCASHRNFLARGGIYAGCD